MEQVQTPAFVTTFTRGAEWAATGKVTLLFDGNTTKFANYARQDVVPYSR